MTIDVYRLISQTQAAYAHAIDNDRLEDWPGFFADPCLYVITTAENHRQGLEAGVVFANSNGMLRDRVSALREANIFERHSYRHLLGAPLVLAERDDEIDSETPFIVARIMRTGETDLYATGRYIDTYQVADGTATLKRRLVVLDSSRIDTLLAIPL
ncbi:MAG: aromatic-ring-hydroxylating dioxygenase subunit beta [Hyphomicrobiaceae bacterium]